MILNETKLSQASQSKNVQFCHYIRGFVPKIEKMKRVAILVPKGEVMPNAIIGAYFLLTQANLFLFQNGHSPAFDVKIVGYEKEELLYDGSFLVKTLLYKH